MNSFVNSFFSSFNKSNLVRREQVITYNPKLVTGTAGDLSLWLDAADINNSDVQPTNGSYITTWKDKSDYGNDASSVGVLFQINTLNSFPSLSFQNSDDSTFRCNINKSFSYNETIRSSIINGNQITIFIVSSMSPDSSDKARLISFSIDSNTNDFDNPSSISIQRELSGVTDQDTTYGVVRNNASVYQTYDSTVLSYNKPYITKVIFNGTNGTINSLVGSSTNNDFSFSSSSNFNIQYCRIGGNTNDNNMDDQGLFKGYISEILVYNKLLDLNQTKIIEGYLSWKWGLQSNLPATHPYKVNRITLISSFTNVNSSPLDTVQLTWTYSSYKFEVDIYRNNVKIASNYKITTPGISNDDYLDIGLSPSTNYTYNLYQVGDTINSLANLTVTTTSITIYPNNINNLKLWLDANDVNGNGTFPANNTNITQWSDKSGIGNHSTSVGVKFYLSIINSKPSVLFTNGGNYFKGNVSITNTNSITIIFVTQSTEIIGDSRVISLGRTGQHDYNTPSHIGIARPFLVTPPFFVNRNNRQVFDNYNLGINTPYLTYSYVDGTNMYTNTHIGTNTRVADFSNTTSGNFDTVNYAIGGALVNTAYSFKGYISEVIVYDRSLTLNERQAIEGYLSSKWGLQDKLLSSHPFKNIQNQISYSVYIISFTNVETTYNSTRLSWTYSGTAFNVDIYSGSTKIVANYPQSSTGSYSVASLTPNTTYYYTLTRVSDSGIIAKVIVKTPTQP